MPLGLHRQSLHETITPITEYNVDVLIVGGGGGSGQGHGAGGAGGGGIYRTYGITTDGNGDPLPTPVFDVGTTYTITVGSGGSPGASNPSNGNFGGNSSITGTGFDTLLAPGGQGGLYSTDATNPAPSTGPTTGGGSGNGASRAGSAKFFGNAGGVAKTSANSTYQNGGGGGAGTAGKDGSTGTQADNGDGGNGIANSITGSSITYAGGGGGSIYVSGGGDGGSGGGGDGSFGSGSAQGGGTNTGGGAGGTRVGSAASGGSGVVIIRLATSNYTGTTTGSPTVTTDGDFTVVKFTASGSYTA